MPELPEVETVVRAIRPNLINRTITNYWNDWSNRIKTHPDAVALRSQLVGQTVLDVYRRAKYIIIVLTDSYLVLHLRMSGHLSVLPTATALDKYTHDIFTLDNNTALHFRDTRKFGTVELHATLDPVEQKLGPEPLASTFTPAVLRERLASSKRMMKAVLLDQKVVAGVGNIYADEALFDASIDPRRPANTLTDDEITRLHAGIVKVLEMGIAREGASIDTYVKPDGTKGDMQNAVMVFRRTDQPCRVCGTTIERIKITQRSTHFCPTCQR